MDEKSGWTPEESSARKPGERESIADLIRRLVVDGRAYAEAEAARQKTKALFIAVNVRDIAIAAIIALFVLFGLLVAGLLGVMWILEPYTGRILAVLLSLGGAMALIMACGFLILGRIRRLKGPRP